ncbi:MAG: 5-formyltetrahydrofolate cyclo-ligase [Lachnospiraceae bacterium]|nr:5-formyltetrahydrofolate cyclo-ligase [Lachnospiraceae bacterium]
MTIEDRKQLRKSKIQARDKLSPDEREALSGQIVERIVASKEFQKAKTIMIYRATRGEVRLEELERTAEGLNKRLVYPLCINDKEMIALFPSDSSAWKSGYKGIEEPVREHSIQINPEEINMVICPCTVFDEQGGRMGMGKGFYDRYLEKCTNASVAAVAFEVQKTECVPRESWDKEMDMIFTEAKTYKPCDF